MKKLFLSIVVAALTAICANAQLYVGAGYSYLIKNIYAGEQVSFKMIIVSYCLITVIPDSILCVAASILCKKIKTLLLSALEGGR